MRKLIFIITILSACSYSKQEEQPLQKQIAGIIDHDTIYMQSIDSIISYAIQEERRKALNVEVLKKMAQKGRTIPDSISDQKSLENYIQSLKENNRLQSYVFSPDQEKMDIHGLYYHSSGDGGSGVELTVIFDYECGHCIQTLSQLTQNLYIEKIKTNYIFYSDAINMPAMACEAASEQGKYFQYLSRYLAHSKVWNSTTMMQLADELKLDVRKFNADLNNDSIAHTLQSTINSLKRRNLYSVPRFIINGRLQDSQMTFEVLIDKIKFLLEKKKA